MSKTYEVGNKHFLSSLSQFITHTHSLRHNTIVHLREAQVSKKDRQIWSTHSSQKLKAWHTEVCTKQMIFNYYTPFKYIPKNITSKFMPHFCDKFVYMI
jgi:hypothetical protein